MTSPSKKSDKDELDDILAFVEDFRNGGAESLPEMETQLRQAIGFGQRVGEMLNIAERGYRLKFAQSLNNLMDGDGETETTRRAKLESYTAEERYVWQNLKVLSNTLKQVKMGLFQAIKTRREEPYRMGVSH
jgi:hypothetical protein